MIRNIAAAKALSQCPRLSKYTNIIWINPNNHTDNSPLFHMESTPGKRLLEWREYKGITLAEMSRITGIRTTTLSSSEQPGSSNPSYDTITKVLAGFPDLNPDWLLLGSGPMLRGGRVLSPTPAPASETAPVVAGAPQPGLTSGPATVAEAENILLRERIADKDIIIEMLRAELGKSNDSPDAAGNFPTNPRKPISGFMTDAQRAEIAEAFNEVVEEELSEGSAVVVRR